MSKEFAVVESMTTVHVHRYKIRVWREEDEPGPFFKLTVEWMNKIADDLSKKDRWTLGQDEIARRFAVEPRVNAVEVVDSNGNGIVVYQEWP